VFKKKSAFDFSFEGAMFMAACVYEVFECEY